MYQKKIHHNEGTYYNGSCQNRRRASAFSFPNLTQADIFDASIVHINIRSGRVIRCHVPVKFGSASEILDLVE
jgi:hypothetical protein